MQDETRADSEHWDSAEEGAERLAEGDIEGARAELERLIADEPDNPYAYFFLGGAHFEAGDFERAMKAYLLTLERAPRHAGALSGLGHSLRLLGRYQEALKVGVQILARDKEDADGHYLMGLCHFARGEEAEATVHFERFLETGPEVETAQEVRGLLSILRGEVESA